MRLVGKGKKREPRRLWSALLEKTRVSLKKKRSRKVKNYCGQLTGKRRAEAALTVLCLQPKRVETKSITETIRRVFEHRARLRERPPPLLARDDALKGTRTVPG